MTSPDTRAPADPRPPDPPDAATDDPVVPLHRNRDFLLLWGGSAVSQLGSTATTIAYPLLVLAITGSPFAAGLAGFVTLLPALLLPLPAGALVDRWPRRRLMIWCDALRALGAATIAVASALDVLGLPLVLAVGFAEGALTVFHGLAAHAAVPNVVPPSQLSLALSRNEARGRAAVMLGTPLGGVLFGLGRAVPFLADALTYLVSLTGLLFIRKEFEAKRSARTGSMREQVHEGLRWLWRQPFLRTTTLLVAGSNLMFRALFLVAIVLATDIGASSTGVGLMVGFAGAGGVLGSLAAPWFARRVGLGTLVIGANWAWTVLMAVIALSRDPFTLTAAYAAMWFVGPLWNVALGSYQLSITPDPLRGRVLAATSTLSNGALPIGSLLGGLLLDSVGARTAALALAGWMVVIAGAASLARSVRAAPGPPAR
ncbi:MFS transporter [Streptomyces phaeoluteigriseus]|uniref:MFS transporter n=1 Tax=Streptomyces phaeoluteigriseus TaxID=114686 RepID=A0ABY4ZG85_9ACTN|nr:MFS transporter [Streptomyces phaeoluteigriseus]USQ87999.1 MFS transporter [Streptomyces phaeoluteigriseus]